MDGSDNPITAGAELVITSEMRRRITEACGRFMTL